MVRDGAVTRSPRLLPFATIRELMDDVVDPSADRIWESVGTIRTRSTTIRREPRTGDQWAAVRAQALTLAESANLLIIGPRHAAPEGTIAGEDELSPAEIDDRIATNRDAFEELAVNLRNLARKALGAIDRRNSEELFDVGGEIDVACEACHATFWYPGQANRKVTK
jgi:cytochrome c556